MYNSISKHSALAILLLVVLGVSIRLAVLDHGFPDINEEATPVRQAWEMWDWQTATIDLNPKFFNYPAFSFYINGVAQGVFRLATESTGLREWGPSETLPLDLVLIGRILSILFSLGISTLTYHLGKKLMPAVWAAWAAVATFWMPTLFHYSLLSVVDLPLGFFAILALNSVIRRKQQSLNTAQHLRIGLLIGLAASCKYTGAFLAIPYLLMHISTNRWNLRKAFLTPRPWLAGLVTITVFLALNPYILLDYETFYKDLSFERQHMSVGHFGRLDSPLSEYSRALWLNLGPLLLVTLVTGSIGALRSPRRDLWIPLIGFALFYPSFLVIWSTSFGHYLIPVLPLLVLLAVYGLRIAVVAMRRRYSISGLWTGLPLLGILPLLISSFEDFSHYRQPAPRSLAREWIEASVQPATILAVEPGGPTIRKPYLGVVLPMHTTDPAQSSPAYNPKWYEPIDLFLLIEGIEKRYRSEPDRFPDQNHFYEDIDQRWEMVARFGREGDGIRIYRNPDVNRKDIRSYPDTLYARIGSMNRVLAGRFLERLGTAFRDAGRLELAGDVYNRLVTNLPENQNYTLAYADILLSMKDERLAIKLLESRRASGDDHLKASLFFIKAEYDSAAAAWARYAELRQGNIKVRINLGRIFLTMGKPTEALSWYLDAIKIGATDIEPYLKACALLKKSGEGDRASRIAREGLKRWPQNAALKEWAE